jgi:hypothetical protein
VAAESSPIPGPDSDRPTATADPEAAAGAARSVAIVSVEGEVALLSAPDAEPRQPIVGDLLPVGGQITTGEDGRVVLALDDGTAVVVNPGSIFTLTELEGTTENPITRFLATLGQIFAFHSGDMPEDSAFEVQTPSGVAAIRGSSMGVTVGELPAGASARPPGRARSIMQEDAGTTLVCLTGTCTAQTPTGETITLEGGQKVTFQGGELGEIEPLTDDDLLSGGQAFETAQGAGLVLGLNPEDFVITTPEPPTPTPTVTLIIPPTIAPGITTQTFDVYYCRWVGEGIYEWYEVMVTYDDGVPVSEEIISGPYQGTWQPGCPVPEQCIGTSCGDLTCQTFCGETYEGCPADCPEPGYCGDGRCLPIYGETNATCPADCPPAAVCGDEFCDMVGGENAQNCPQDCGSCNTDGVCQVGLGEDANTCPFDCYCADFLCDPYEFFNATCDFKDCWYGGYCGNGICESSPTGPEYSGDCPEDCPP